MWKSMLSTTGPDQNLLTVILVLVLMIAYLAQKKQKKKKVVQSYRIKKGRNILKLIFKFLGEKSSTKRPLYEHLYRSTTLKEIMDEGTPKFFNILNITGLFIADDYDSIKEVLRSKECNGRFPPSLSNILTGGLGHHTGFMLTGGPQWNELRKYTFKKLGQLGFHKIDKMTLLLSEVLSDLMNDLRNIKNSTQNKIPVKDLFVLPAVNTVWPFVAGQKFLSQDENFLKIYKNVETILHTSVWKFGLLSILPNSKLIHYIIGCDSFCNAGKILNEFMKGLVDERMKLTKPEPEDFIDHFLLEIEKHKNNAVLKNYYCKDQLVQILSELFESVSDTASKFMEFSLMYMVQHQEIQKKVQMEIDTVIGNNSPLFSDHRQRMPYTSATIMEIHRMANIIPIVPKFTEKDWENKGEVLEKGNQIGCVLWAVRMNESFWGDPSKFRPERYLNDDNSFIGEKVNRVMPFSYGLRSCPGESVASAAIFTFFVGIMQKYTVTKAIENELLGIDHTVCGYVNQPFPFHVSLLERV